MRSGLTAVGILAHEGALLRTLVLDRRHRATGRLQSQHGATYSARCRQEIIEQSTADIDKAFILGQIPLLMTCAECPPGLG